MQLLIQASPLIDKLKQWHRAISFNEIKLSTSQKVVLWSIGVVGTSAVVVGVLSKYLARRRAKPIINPRIQRAINKRISRMRSPNGARRKALQFKCVVNGEELDLQAANTRRVFTDGSKIGGKVGASVSLWDGDAETKATKIKLGSFCTVYQAELLALHKAVQIVSKEKYHRYSIFCDSRAALETVARGNSLHPIAFDITKMLNETEKRGKTINLFWVKAHVGLEGNERADELAKAAATTLKRRPDYDQCPISFVKRQIRQESIDEWNERYRAGKTASVTKLFFPDANKAYKVIRKIPVDQVLTQVFTGHGGFSEYLNRFKCKESPSCICDPAVKEDVVHVLTECPIYLYKRTNFELELGIIVNKENLSGMLENNEIRNKFLKYCKEITCSVRKRNQ